MTYYVYLIQSKKDQSKYIGQTDNLLLRIDRHNTSKVKYTKAKVPWELVKYEKYQTRSEARWREYQLKHNASMRKKFYGI
jgi:putative endonuclease